MAEGKGDAGDVPVRAGEEPELGMEGWISLSPFERLLGMRIEGAEAGEAVLSMPFTLKLAQGLGLMHGGAITSLADTAAAMAIKSLLPEGTSFATVGLETTFLAPVREGTLRATARTQRMDTRSWRAEVRLECGGEEVAVFSALFRVSRRHAG